MELQLAPVGLDQGAKCLLVAGAGSCQRGRFRHHLNKDTTRAGNSSLNSRPPLVSDQLTQLKEALTMTAKQRWVLGCMSLASVMVALDALAVLTALSTIRLQDPSETRASNLGPDR